MSVGAIVAQSKGAAGRSIALASWPLHAVVTAPEYLYLGTLTIFLFRPPDVNLYHLDRISSEMMELKPSRRRSQAAAVKLLSLVDS